MRKKLLSLAFFGSILNPETARADPAKNVWPAGPIADLQFESSVFMKSTADASPDKLSSDSSSSGAYGPYNKDFDLAKSKTWYIESQRFAFDVIGGGLVWKRTDLIDRGLHILDWGFQHQNPDGSFSCPDAFHSSAFFIEASARAALLLRASEYNDHYSVWIAHATPKILSAARWMARPDIFAKGISGDEIYTHRYYLNADALGFAGLLGNDPSLVEISKKLVAEAIGKQDSKGFNPEKGGFDTSYNSVGLVFALRYYSIVADQELRKNLDSMISQSLIWLKFKIKKDGSVDQNGNTRTGNGQEVGRDKKIKTMSYGSAARAFAYWSQIKNIPEYQDIALKLYEYGKKHPH